MSKTLIRAHPELYKEIMLRKELVNELKPPLTSCSYAKIGFKFFTISAKSLRKQPLLL